MGATANSTWREVCGARNPLLVRGLGLTPVVAAAVDPISGLLIGVAYLAVLLGANVWTSLMRDYIAPPERGLHIAIAAAVVAGAVDQMLAAIVFAWHARLTPYIVLLAASALVHDRAASVALRSVVGVAVRDALQHGLVALGVALIAGTARWALGGGSIAALERAEQVAAPMAGPAAAATVAGGFIVVGLLAAGLNAWSRLAPAGIREDA